MGLFDSVYVKCKCGEDIEFQSKAGESYMASYTLENAPNAIKGDLVDRSESCQKCGEPTTIRGHFHLYVEQ